jgi:RNA polymerase sigma-70 factor, ECF subfamily
VPGARLSFVDASTEQALRAGAGDRDALSRLVEGTQADVWRLCAHLVDREAADDLTQETFLRTIKALPTFRGESSVHTFVLSIARRTCADEIRRRSRRRILAGRLERRAAAEPTTVDPVAAVPLDDLVTGLGDDRREAFVLTQVLGLGYAEAAEVCGCPVGTIRSRVARARQDLLDALDASDGRAGRLDGRAADRDA